MLNRIERFFAFHFNELYNAKEYHGSEEAKNLKKIGLYYCYLICIGITILGFMILLSLILILS